MFGALFACFCSLDSCILKVCLGSLISPLCWESEKRIMPKLQPLQHNTTNLRSIFTHNDTPCSRNKQTINHELKILTLRYQGCNKLANLLIPKDTLTTNNNFAAIFWDTFLLYFFNPGTLLLPYSFLRESFRIVVIFSFMFFRFEQ